MIDKNHVEEKILKVLSKHSEGLSILDIARLVSMHRHTVTKYIYALIASQQIVLREVGPAKLCYLRARMRR